MQKFHQGRFAGPIQTNKTFFFVDWQGTRLRTGITRFSVVPTVAQRQGVFTQPIFDPSTSPEAAPGGTGQSLSDADFLKMMQAQQGAAPGAEARAEHGLEE